MSWLSNIVNWILRSNQPRVPCLHGVSKHVCNAICLAGVDVNTSTECEHSANTTTWERQEAHRVRSVAFAQQWHEGAVKYGKSSSQQRLNLTWHRESVHQPYSVHQLTPKDLLDLSSWGTDAEICATKWVGRQVCHWNACGHRLIRTR